MALLPVMPATRVWRRCATAVAAGGAVVVVVLATSWLDLSTTAKGTGATIGTASMLVALESGVAGRIAGLLSTGVFVAVGKLSYSIYLWHILVIYLVRRTWDLPPILLFGVVMASSTALAFVSGRLLETPVRRSRRLDRIPRSVIGVGLAFSLLGAVLVVPAALRTRAEPSDVALDWEGAKHDAAPIVGCRDAEPSACVVRSGSGLRVALVGDSHVRVWQSAFEVIAEQRDLTLSVLWLGGCSWHRDVMVVVRVQRQQDCFAAQADWYDRVIPALDPDIVVLVHRATFDPALPFLANLDAFLRSSTSTVEALHDDGRTVAILEPLPATSKEADPRVCLSRGGPVDSCGFDATASPTPLEERYRRLEQRDLAISIDADRLMCPDLPRCDAVRDGMITMRDNTHMTATYARSLAGALDDMLVGRGVLPPRA